MQNLLSSRFLFKNLKIKIYRTIILPVVLYGCETWLLTLWEERKLRVFENGVEENIWTKEGRGNGGLEENNEELNDLYSSPNIVQVIKSRRMRWAEHVARMGEEKRDLGIGGWITVGWISKRWDVGIWTGLGWPRWQMLVSVVMILRAP